jgi:hypothetical protein
MARAAAQVMAAELGMAVAAARAGAVVMARAGVGGMARAAARVMERKQAELLRSRSLREVHGRLSTSRLHCCCSARSRGQGGTLGWHAPNMRQLVLLSILGHLAGASHSDGSYRTTSSAWQALRAKKSKSNIAEVDS